jgi:hypothetical protein
VLAIASGSNPSAATTALIALGSAVVGGLSQAVSRLVVEERQARNDAKLDEHRALNDAKLDEQRGGLDHFLAARGGGLHRPDDAHTEPREADVRRSAAAFVGRLTAGLPRIQSFECQGAGRRVNPAAHSATPVRKIGQPISVRQVLSSLVSWLPTR